MKSYLTPLLLVIIGTGMLLAKLHLLPTGVMLWALALASGGLLVFIAGGFSKDTFVFGAFLLVCAACAVLRGQGSLDPEIEIPVLIIALGILLGVNRTALIPPARKLP